ncbi:hypothetical protein HDF10_000713 [Edaphobacter lichenicola]|uniref:Carboxypeptidase regulatory-like domain-containing protein n=2 Tax=Tunturiibacter TaxID=3154218 RepID=A0A7W8J578_9BACT|nr:hypothetical protein [Edaphobacter lichenicola]
MTSCEIEKLIDITGGHLCARVTHRADGSLVMLDSTDRTSLATHAAGLVACMALATGSGQAQSNPVHTDKAFVSGTLTGAKGDAPPTGAQVIFLANGAVILSTNTDATGHWSAQLDPGTYDVIFRLGPLFGERVNAVQLHAGEQSFAQINAHFAYGRLGVEDHSEQFTTFGEMTATYKYPVSYLFKHPLRYLKHLPHNFS